MEAAYATSRSGEPDSPFDLPVVLRSSRDLLAAVPYLLGFRPRECCVVACVTREGQVGLVARTPLGDPGGPAPEARAVARAAARAGTCLAVVVVCTARPAATVRADARVMVSALEEVLDPPADVEAWLVGPDGYRGLDCAEPACCPPQGRPLGELEHGEVGAAFVVAGRAVAPSEQEAHRIRRPSATLRDRVAKAAARAERARLAARNDGSPDRATVRWREGSYDAWCALLRQAAAEQHDHLPGEVALPPARLGRLAAALADVPVRDAVLLSLVPGGREAAARTVGTACPGGTGDVEVDGGAGPAADVEVATARAIARVVDPRVGVPPDAATADAARLVLEQVVGGAPRRWHAAPLALLGFLAWWRGDGCLAGRRVREALRQDPSHRLAALLAGVLQAAVPPGWVAPPGGTSPNPPERTETGP
ncbi:DUF4192 domain-containing protein [Isoptericola sp. NPDC055881]